jgi:hypothetical protein
MMRWEWEWMKLIVCKDKYIFLQIVMYAIKI